MLNNKLTSVVTNTLFLSGLFIILGIIGLNISTIISNPYTVLYPSVLIASPITFFVIKWKRTNNVSRLPYFEHHKPILSALFITTATLTIFYHRSGLWRGDIEIYLTFIIYIIAALALFTRLHAGLKLSLVIMAGLLNRLTAYYGSNLYSGIDIYSHTRWTNSIASSGSLDIFSSNRYFYSPFYHIIGAEAEILLNISTRDALALTILFTVSVIPTLAAFLLGRYLRNEKTGLLASFLYITSDQSIQWAIHAIPTSLGVVFFSILLLYILKFLTSGDIRQYLIVVVMFISLTLTHQVSFFIGFSVAVALSFCILIFKSHMLKTAIGIGSVSIILLFFDFTTTKHGGPTGEESFFDVMLSNFMISVSTANVSNRAEVSFPDWPSVSATGASSLTYIQIFGSTLLLFFAVIGALYWLDSSESEFGLFTGISSGLIATMMLVVTLAGPLVGLRSLLPGRWWAFTYLILVVFAAVGVLWIVSNNLTSEVKQKQLFILIILVLLPYVILMAGTSTASLDNPFFDNAPGAERHGLTEGEVSMMEHTAAYQAEDSIHFSDRRFRSYVSRYYDINMNVIRFYGDKTSAMASNQTTLLTERKYASTKHAQYYIREDGVTFTVHGKVPVDAIPIKNKERIYTNGQDNMYVIDPHS